VTTLTRFGQKRGVLLWILAVFAHPQLRNVRVTILFSDRMCRQLDDKMSLHGISFGRPNVECARDAHNVGRWMSAIEANGHGLKPCLSGVVMVRVVFHNCELRSFFAETHLPSICGL